MPNIRVDLDYTIRDGSEIKFRSPVDCSAITGLIVYYPGADGSTTSNVFALADAHGNNVGDIDHLFAENVVVKVILDVTSGMAFVQNADTNAYLEGRFRKLQEEVDQLEQQGVTDKSIAEAVDKYMEENPIALDDLGAAPAALGLGRAGGTLIAVNDSGDVPLQSLKLFGKTTQNGTPSLSSPVPLVSAGDSGSIGVTVAGKNLHDLSKDYGYNKIFPLILPAGTPITFSVYPSAGTSQFNAEVLYSDGTKDVFNIVGSYGANGVWHTKKFTATKNTKSYMLYDVTGSAKRTINKLMLRIGNFDATTDADYEPYKETQILTAATPNGLPGIPVTAGGNCTDENGQQWICDVRDYGQGVTVKNVPFVTLSDLSYSSNSTQGLFHALLPHPAINTGYDENTAPHLMCNTLPSLTRRVCTSGTQGVTLSGNYIYVCVPECTTVADLKAWFTSHPTHVVYRPATILNEPEPIPADELSAFAALHTNKPNTTVYTDSGAHMEMEYATELSALPISGGRMGGKLGMAGNRITDVGEPVADSDAVNKAYVDGLVGSGNDLMEDSEHPGCYYRMVDGVKEWQNPPGVVGVAYRTTERYKGYPVWVKTVSIGDSVANTPVSVSFLTYGVDFFLNCVEPFRTHASTLSGGDFGYAQTIPNVVAYAGDGMFEYYVEVTTKFDASYIFATVWYITYD